MSYMASKDELDSLFYYSTFIFSVPLIFHLMYLFFFSDDTLTSGKAMKLYLASATIIYLSLVWYNARNIYVSENTNATLIQLLTYYPSLL
jgi:hypothetical protein